MALQPWSDDAIRHLLDYTVCPVCGVDALHLRHCANCGAEFSDQLANALWAASRTAADALTARQGLLDQVPHSVAARTSAGAPPTSVSEPAGTQEAGVPNSYAATPSSPPAPSYPTPPSSSAERSAATERSSATVQSVLAVAGAGLFAVAAIVFTFFNPDLTDHVLRSVIVGVITLLFVGGAWLLARRTLQFSAEAVGALSMVFVALDVYAVSELIGSGVSRWALAALGTLVSAAVMAAISTRARIRSWLWLSLLGLAIVPAMLGYAGGTTLSAMLGHLGSAFAAFALLEASAAGARMFDGRLRSERVMLSTVQILATALVLTQALSIKADTVTNYWLIISATLAAVALLAGFSTRQLAREFWSFVAGATATVAVVVLPFALDLGSSVGSEWYLFAAPAAGALALVAFGALTPTPRTVVRPTSLGGVFAVASASVLVSALAALIIGAVTVLGALAGLDNAAGELSSTTVLAVIFGLTAMAAGFGAVSVISSRRPTAQAAPGQTIGATMASKHSASTAAVAAWLATLAGLTLACLPTLPLWARITVALGLAVAVSVALIAAPRLRTAATRIRIPLILGAHIAVLLAGIISWADRPTSIWAGIAVVLAIAVVVRIVPKALRFVHVGVGYAYALIVVATSLDQLGFGTIAMLCLTTSLGSIGAIVATFLRRVTPSAWHAILVVTAVPFMIGVVQVVFERSGWTALSTGLIFLLALTLLTTRRPGLGVVVRTVAAGLLVPSLAIVVICLGAQVLLASASPVTLPIIAVLVAVVLPSTGLIRRALERHGIKKSDATTARIAIEASTLATGAIAVLLALVRVAAGLPTTFVVLIILGIGAGATSFWTKRRYGWPVAFAAFSGAMWCLWALIGIDALEPYLLPPAMSAVIIALILTARGGRALPLYSTGLVVAVTPLLVVLAAFGSGPTASAAWRGYGLIAASWLLVGIGMLLGKGATVRAERVRPLRVPTLWVAILTGAAGAIQGVRFGIGADSIAGSLVAPIMLSFAVALAGALPAAGAAHLILAHSPRESRIAHSRWLYAPAALFVAVGTWSAIEREWFTIWAMWLLMLAYLVLVVATAWRLRRGPTTLPPVWFSFAIAFVTAIVAWSPRDLRVEWFSLPLGLFLLAAGAIILRSDRTSTGTQNLNSWPGNWSGSWPLLAPGIVTVMLASIIATFTDPLTWRAVLVMVLALIAILIGSRLRLAAPFLIGIVVLPIENIFVFLVQIGQGVESMPWWVTLAVIGAVLLIIAVTYERRQGEGTGIAARLRDLR